MGTAEDFVEAFARDIPGLEEAYEIHIENEGELLDHVFFAIDVVKPTVASYLGCGDDGPDWRLVLPYLEEKFKLHIPEIDQVIVTSFLDLLPYKGQPGADIIYSLGPEMKKKLAELRSVPPDFLARNI